MTTANLIEIFCILDEFCKYFTPELKKHMVDTSGKRRRLPEVPSKLWGSLQNRPLTHAPAPMSERARIAASPFTLMDAYSSF